MTETELLDKIKTNPELFSEVFALYYRPIFGYILRRTGNVDDTADIAAETFFKAWKHINAFSYRGISLKVWLFRIATNETNLHFRRMRSNNSLFERIDDRNKAHFAQLLQDDRQELESELQKHEQFLDILKSLKTLPLKYQEVIALKYFEGKDNNEIAEILDMNLGTLKSLLSRGLEKLREKCNQI